MNPSIIPYAALTLAKGELLGDETIVGDKLFNYILQVSRRIDHEISTRNIPYFAPSHSSIRLVITPQRVSRTFNRVQLDFPFLRIDEVLLDEEDITSQVDYRPWDGHYLYMDHRRWNTTNRPVLKVTGITGYDSTDSYDYASVWSNDPDLTITDALDSIQKGIILEAYNGASTPFLTEPAIDVGRLIRIGNEFMLITELVDDTTISVIRGYAGSTAAAHDAATSIEFFYPDPNIVRLTSRQAGLLYARRGAYQAEVVDGLGMVSYPQDLLSELYWALNAYQYS